MWRILEEHCWKVLVPWTNPPNTTKSQVSCKHSFPGLKRRAKVASCYLLAFSHTRSVQLAVLLSAAWKAFHSHRALTAPSELIGKASQTLALAIRAESDANSICQLEGDASETRAILRHRCCETWLPASLHASTLMACLKERSHGVGVCWVGW